MPNLKSWPLLGLILLMGLLTGCFTPIKLPSAEKAGVNLSQPPSATEYRVTAGDVLKISILRQSDLQPAINVETARVDVNGGVSLPLVGLVQLGGMDTETARSTIQSAYKKELISPVVYIEVKESRGSQIFILGEVKTPGIYRVAPNMTALEAVLQAGGFSKDAALGNVVLLRKGAVGPSNSGTAAGLDFDKLFKKADFKQDVAIIPGDVLYIPPDYIARSDRFFNHVSNVLSPITNASGSAASLYLISQQGTTN